MKSEVRGQSKWPRPLPESSVFSQSGDLYLLPCQPLLSASPFRNMLLGARKAHPSATFKDTGSKAPWEPGHGLNPSQHSHPRSCLMSLLLQPLTPDSAPEDLHLPQTHPTRTPSTVFWLSSHLPCPLQPAALFPGLRGSTLAFLMLMEVSTPGRKLKPPSSMKAGSSCPCTITLAPVTVDSSGMKSFCSVRSIRDRPGGAEGAEWGRSWRVLGDGNPLSHLPSL